MKLHSKARKSALFLLASLILPSYLLLSQLHSTGEFGFQTYAKKTYPIEFVSWTGSWRADRREHQTFAWFSSSLENLDTSLYPDKAFSSSEEKTNVETLFRTWKQQGYNDTIRAGFKELVRSKRQSQPIEFYVINPLYRMYHHWVNLEGADFFLASFLIPPGLASRSLVAIIFILRITALFLFIYGATGFCHKAKYMLGKLHLHYDRPSHIKISSPDWLVGFSMIFVIMRTLEMGLLSTLHAGGLMEPRYVTVAFPPLLIVSIYGFFRLVDSFRKTPYSKHSV